MRQIFDAPNKMVQPYLEKSDALLLHSFRFIYTEIFQMFLSDTQPGYIIFYCLPNGWGYTNHYMH